MIKGKMQAPVTFPEISSLSIKPFAKAFVLTLQYNSK